MNDKFDLYTLALNISRKEQEELARQAGAMGIEPGEWAHKLLTSGIRQGREAQSLKPAARRFMVTPEADLGVYDTVEDAEQVAARRAEAKKQPYVVVPTDREYLDLALVARWQGVVIQEAKL